MKISVIVSIYKDLEALRLILNSLSRQTYRDFEVVVAEDNDAPLTKEVLSSFKNLQIIHTSHPDIGRTKQASQNRAVCASTGEYLIFIDGDCIPYTTFVAGHAALAKPRRVLSGRRVNLPEDISQLIRQGAIDPDYLERNYFWFGVRRLFWDREVRAEQGIYIDPTSWLYRHIFARRTRNTQLLGCNFSCFKEDFVAINGFDESYGLSILGDDNDLNWRFADYGCELYSSKNVTNQFHLFHARPAYNYDPTDDIRRFNERRTAKQYRCSQGLNRYC